MNHNNNNKKKKKKKKKKKIFDVKIQKMYKNENFLI